MVQRPKSPVAVIVALLVPVVIIALYVVGYFQLTPVYNGGYSRPPVVVRVYPHPGIGWLYYPAAFVEAKIKRKEVWVGVVVGTSGQPLYRVAP